MDALDILAARQKNSGRDVAPNADTLTTGNASPDSADALSILSSRSGVAEPPTGRLPRAKAGAIASLMNPQVGVDPRELAKNALDLAPMAGGIGGGILGGAGGTVAGFGVGGGPGAVGGAGLGGAGGESIRQLGYRALGLPAPESSLEAAKDIGGQGALQAATELFGQGTMKGAKMIAPALMRAAARLTPEAAQTMLEEGINATRGGLNKIMTTLGNLGQRAEALAGQATKSGVRFDPNKDVIQPALAEVMPSVQAGRDPAGEAEKLMGYAQKWLEGRFKPASPGISALPDKISPTELFKAKQAADDFAGGIYKGLKKLQVTEFDPLEQRFNKALADRIRTLFTDIPGLGEITQRESRLIAAKEALEPIVSKDLGVAARMARPGMTGLLAGTGAALSGGGNPEQRTLRGLGGLAAGAAIGSPAGLSISARLAEHLSNPIVQQLLRQAPRAAAQEATTVRQTGTQ